MSDIDYVRLEQDNTIKALQDLVRQWQEFATSVVVLQDIPDEHKHPWMDRKRLEELDMQTRYILKMVDERR